MDYIELDIVINARELVKETYSLSNRLPDNESYNLVSHLRKTSVSVASNIAEAYGRHSFKEMIRFLHIARGSAYELEIQLLLCRDLGFVKENTDKVVNDKITNVKHLISGTIRYLKKKAVNGER